MSRLEWVRVSNATQDPQTKSSVAQDQIVKIVGDDGDWYNIQTIEGTSGRVPKVLTLPIVDPSRQPGQLIYCSTDSYTSIRSDDLSFAPFSLFVASPSKRHEGYLEGYLVTDNGSQLGGAGLLPDGYLVHLPSASDKKGADTFLAPSGMTPSFTTNFAEVDVKFRNLPPPSAAASSNYSVAPYARAIYDFQGEFANELSFKADEIITLMRRIDAEWLEGTVDTGRSGIFPASFVQIIVALPEDEESDSIKRRSTATANENDGIGFANVRHAFKGRQSDELDVSAGDTVRVLRMVNDEWVMCKDPDSERTGIVPVGFLEIYLDDEDDEDSATRNRGNNTTFAAPSSGYPDWRTSTRLDAADTMSIKSSSTQNWATFGDDWMTETAPKTAAPARPPPPKVTSPNDVVSVTEMFGMSERQAPPRPNAPSSMFSSPNDFIVGLESATAGATTNEDKRLKILEELISSELQFITDINSYTEAVEGSTLLSNKQKIIMKNGCAQIVQLSANLVQFLTNEQMKPSDAQQIGACFLQLRKPFAQTYGYYFRNIEHINQLLTSAKTEKTMEDALNDVVRRMRDSGAGVIDGATAVGRPVQRCLKYPLFLNEIVKVTPVNQGDHPKLLEAIKLMSNLGLKMNESKRRKELTRKYMSEDRQTFGEMLSKMTFHSLKKKSNRFTYRMGSSLGVVKLLRDVEFDNLVCELDSAERRLVRYNYMLVIYWKKMFHETRILMNKRLIEPRKKVLSSADIDQQIYLFNEAVNDFVNKVKLRVRDEIVKALRNIPKRLIKKRNDKLMDYEAAKSNHRGNGKRDFVEIQKDYEALNAQVKQELPKTIDQLNKVLAEAMKNVVAEDGNLMTALKKHFDSLKSISAADPNAQMKQLVLSNTVCFVGYYDTDRLKPLQKIANKGAQSTRMRARSASPTTMKKASASASASTSTAVVTTPLEDAWKAPSFAPAPSVAAVASSSESTSRHENKFRAQTVEERKTILEKATAKGRLHDMFIATSSYPQDPEMVKIALKEGKLLIVRQNDLVLAVNREVPSMWLCYNGYYNAMLPSNVLKPYSKAMETGFDVAKSLRPASVPAKSQNLLDLEDVFGGPSPIAPTPLTSVQAAAPSSIPVSNSFVVDWNVAAQSLPLAPVLPKTLPLQSTFAQPQQPTVQTPLAGANYNLNDNDLFSGVSSIDWGSSTKSRTPSAPNIYANAPDDSWAVFNTDSLPATAPPPLPVYMNPSKEFDDVFSTLPPIAPSTSMAQRSSSAAANAWPMNSSSTVVQRAESPQPLIPSRPMPNTKTNVYPNLNSYDLPPKPEQSSGAFYSQPPTYSQPPSYDVVPTAPAPAAALYDAPPSQQSFAAFDNYDQPPGENYDQPPAVLGNGAASPSTSAVRPVLCEVRVDYDFVPQGSNQVDVNEGEKVGVLQRTDDDGNPEWLLVKRENGKVGYVPAAYCRPI